MNVRKQQHHETQSNSALIPKLQQRNASLAIRLSFSTTTFMQHTSTLLRSSDAIQYSPNAVCADIKTADRKRLVFEFTDTTEF